MDSPQSLFTRAREVYSQEQIASKLQRTVRTISRWENGDQPIPAMAGESLKKMLTGPIEPNENKDIFGTKRDFTFIDLFAGIGGTRLGFEAAGGLCVFTSEWDKYAAQTYRANHTDLHKIEGDITFAEVQDQIPSHDILVGGFPCQPFSLAGVSKKNSLGRSHGFKCETQGTLFFEIQKILEKHRPRAFLLENVKNLRSHDRGNTFKVIMKVLRDELGYTVHEKIIDARCLVPQHRERIYLVGFREDLGFNWDNVEFPPESNGPLLEEILHKSNEPAEPPYTEDCCGITRVAEKYTLSDHLWDYLQKYAEKHRKAGNGFGCSVVGSTDVSRTLSARYHKDGSEILIKNHDRNPRRLTPRECARLMGFPDSFSIPVSDTQAYRQFGNSVVVPVIERIANAMAKCLNGKISPSYSSPRD
ncbi:DNA (cytosine-5-)-methyltransferase [Opitutus sp. WL0086]